MAKQTTGIIVSTNSDFVEKLLPEIQAKVDVVKTARGLGPALEQFRSQAPDLLILNLADDARSGLRFVRQIKHHFPTTAVITVAREKSADLILEGLRLGISDFLVLPVRKEDIRIAVERALRREKTPQPTAEIVALFSLKGGQGVTTLAVNLADQIQTTHNQRVLLFDLNLYMGEIGVYLNKPVGYTPFDLLGDIERIDENVLFSSLTLHPRGFYILTAPEEITDADQISGDDLRRMLEVLSDHFDYIVADLPHNFSDQTLAAMEAADHLLVVTVQSVTAIRSVQRTLELFSDLNYRDGKVKIILNRYLRDSDLGLQELRDVFQQPVFAAVSNDYRNLNEAANKHKTIDEACAKTRLNRDLKKLTQRLLGDKASAENDSGLKRLVRKIHLHETE
jgi:pilus assembly protein CpaE